MAKATIKHLQVVDGYLRYRRRVPVDVQPVLGKKQWIHSLGLAIGQEHHAAKIVADYDLAYSGLIAQARVQRVVGSTAVFSPSMQTIPMAGALPVAQPEIQKVKISEAYEYDRKTYGGSRFEKVFEIALESLQAVHGDIDIIAMTPKDTQKWINKCASLGQKPSTIRRRITALRAVINRYFRDHEIEKRNPLSNTQVKDGSGSSNDRLPFNRDHLKLIDRYFQNAPRLTDEIRHVVVLIKLTGARPLEIGGLDAADVILDHEVPHIWIRKNAHRGLKTKGSERRIPLVCEALKAAKAAKAKTPEGPLFAKGCHDTNSLSSRLNQMLRRAGIPKSPRLVVYSFRHTLEEALRAAGVREHTQKRIMGHTDTSITGRYGAPSGVLDELRDGLNSAEKLLGKVDMSIYSESEIST